MRFVLPHHIDPRHSVVTRQYAVYTPPIHAMIQQIGDWIDQQRPGAYIYGASRLGKTKGIQWYLTEVLEERFNVILPLVVWCRPPDSHLSESGFWHEILMASGFKFAKPIKPARKVDGFEHCVSRFISIAESANRNFVILLIDEAQDLTLKEWKWLVVTCSPI